MTFNDDVIDRVINDRVLDEIEQRDPGTTASTNEFLPRTANIQTSLRQEARGFRLYDRTYPEAGWIAGQVMAWQSDIGICQVWQGGLTWVADVRVGLTDGLASDLAFHQLYFPGWRGVGGVAVDERGLGRLWVGTRAPDSRLGSVVGPVPRTVVVRSVADGVVDGTVRVGSPSGAALGEGKYVDVRGMAVQAQDRPLHDAGPMWRRVVYAHPPTELGVEVTLPEATGVRTPWFQAGLVLDPKAWDTPLGDGVRFEVRVLEVGGSWETVVDEVVNPRANGNQRRWNDVVVSLGRWAGRRVEVAMVTDARGEPSSDWAVWGEPTVVMLDELGAGRLTRSAEWIAKVALGRVG